MTTSLFPSFCSNSSLDSGYCYRYKQLTACSQNDDKQANSSGSGILSGILGTEPYRVSYTRGSMPSMIKLFWFWQIVRSLDQALPLFLRKRLLTWELFGLKFLLFRSNKNTFSKYKSKAFSLCLLASRLYQARQSWAYYIDRVISLR